MEKEIVKVELGNRSYDIIIGNNIIDNFAAHLHKIGNYTKIFIITDSNVAKFHLQKFSDHLNKSEITHHTIILEAGEKTKSFFALQNLCEKILKEEIDRKSLLIALGGGMVGDLCGFAASILLRGIDFIQVPTTLLAMVDSSVGGKTAINSEFGKNLIGSFYQPKLVFCDLQFVKTLEQREFLSGYAEVVKYGLIRDEIFFRYLENNWQKIKERNLEVLKNLVIKSCEIKARIVGEDEKEKINLRALLNFGHTFGHIFETETYYSDELLHGEAVAIGMVLAARLSVISRSFDEISFNRIVDHLKKMDLPTSALEIRKDWNIDNLVSHLYKDKKSENRNLTFILLDKIGDALVKTAIPEKTLLTVIENSL